MQPFSGNQRPDLLAALMNMSLVLRLPRKMHLCRSSVARMPSFLVPRVVRTWCVLRILTSKCASCHNGVHFFDISTSKSGSELVCFMHFDFEMCFAPQRRAIVISHLASWLRTRRFSEPTFRPSGATNHLKNTVFCDGFATFSRTWIFFLLDLLSSETFSFLRLSLFWSSFFFSSLLSSPLLSSSLLFSSLLFFDSYHVCFSSVHTVGSLTSKVPSLIIYAW